MASRTTSKTATLSNGEKLPSPNGILSSSATPTNEAVTAEFEATSKRLTKVLRLFSELLSVAPEIFLSLHVVSDEEPHPVMLVSKIVASSTDPINLFIIFTLLNFLDTLLLSIIIKE